ncbi:MAG: ADP-glyceromanno-heptose 6-epimerase [Cytophagales bacterium]|nr:ADP-glyceromanno-heptose 6-epimerase [Cytophagales bacterium]
MIIVTGAAGFIASRLIQKLNQHGFKAIIAVDKFGQEAKEPNLEGLHIQQRVDRDELFGWIDEHQQELEFVFHLGARTDTTEFNMAVFQKLNTGYSKRVWEKCVQYQLPLVYASSAATYGNGELGYNDRTDPLLLQPLNPYGVSKNEFDKWVMGQTVKPFYWAGLKFFNVYGPQEYHKGRMASVVYHAYRQIQQTGCMKLFRSHHPRFGDGEQMRDFIYVNDLVEVMYFLMHHRKNSGLYNLGTGQARSFKDLASAVFAALGSTPQIEYIDTPSDIRSRYQYFTEAKMERLRGIGYEKPFTSLEEGVYDYVTNFLQQSAEVQHSLAQG